MVPLAVTVGPVSTRADGGRVVWEPTVPPPYSHQWTRGQPVLPKPSRPLQATFVCEECQQPAATVVFLPAYRRHPLPLVGRRAAGCRQHRPRSTATGDSGRSSPGHLEPVLQTPRRDGRTGHQEPGRGRPIQPRQRMGDVQGARHVVLPIVLRTGPPFRPSMTAYLTASSVSASTGTGGSCWTERLL